jgi:hypothetical protein
MGTVFLLIATLLITFVVGPALMGNFAGWLRSRLRHRPSQSQLEQEPHAGANRAA